MTAPGAGETGRDLGASGRSPRAPAAIPAIALLLLAGLALRLIIAYVLLPGSGFETDIASFAGWARRLAETGPGTFYATAGFADYPPAYLYVLWLLASAADLLSTTTGLDAYRLTVGLLKVPPMLADIGVAYLLYRLTREWRAGRADAERLGLTAAGLYLLNPVSWYDSAIWGQVDAVGALVMLLAIGLLARGHSEGAAAAAVLAGLVKPQFGIVMAPLVAVVLLRRHLLRPGSGPVPSGRSGLLAGWLVEEQGPWRLVSSAAVGLLTMLAVLVPFRLDLFSFVRLMAGTAGGYPFLTVNAYNPWALVGVAGSEPLAFGGLWSQLPDTVPLLGPVHGVVVGTVLLGLGFLLGLSHLALRDDRRALVLTAVFLSLAFFMLPTRVHERYLFPVFAFLPLLAVDDRRWRWALVALAGGSLINLHAILTIPLYGTPSVDDLPFGEAFRETPWVLLSVALHTVVFGFALLRSWPGVDALLGRAPAPWPTAETPVSEAAAALAPAEPAGVAPGLATSVAPPAPVAPWEEEVRLPWRAGTAAADAPVSRLAGPTPVMVHAAQPAWDEGRAVTGGLVWRLRAAFERHLEARPVRADRSGLLVAEPPGRIDRLDLLVLGLLLVSALTLRGWRLAEPYGMHFDEVYHARTATEFLQHWRYGIPHDIYEFTHPHLAKYAIAAGIVAFGNDRVTGTSELGVAVRDAATERPWSAPGEPGAPPGQHGDRLFVATGGDVRAFDLAGRRQPLRIGVPAVALAIDQPQHVLYLADGAGAVRSLPTDGLADEPTGIGTLPGAPTRLVVGKSGATLFALLDDGRLVAMDTVSGAITGERRLTEPGGLEPLEPVPTLVGDPAAIEDAAAVARRLAEIVDVSAAQIEQRLRDAGQEPVTLVGRLSGDERSQVEAAIAAGELPGVELVRRDSVAAVTGSVVSVLDWSMSEQARVSLGRRGAGLDLVEELDKPTLYVAAGSGVERIEVPRDGEPLSRGRVTMPAEVREVTWDAASNLVHVLGDTPDARGSTVYVIEPHGNAVFADAVLPFAPRVMTLDQQPDRPSQDRQNLLTLADDGRVAVVDAGSHAFSWRAMGVIAGALTTGLIYLMGRFLFRRRSVAIIAAALVLADGMFFAQSRIAMNDAYVQLFIVAAYTLFVPIYLGRWRGFGALLLGIPLVGLLLGLALAAKWVGAYAIGGLLLLILLRSALGRLMALAGMILLTGLLGYLAITPAAVEQPQVNYLFLLIMLGLTLLTAVGIVLRPVRMTLEELRFAVAAPAVLAGLLGLAGLVLGPQLPADGGITTRTLLGAAVLLGVASLGVYLAFSLAGRMGLGPLAADDGDALLLGPSEPPPPGWLLPGWRLGVPWLAVVISLVAIPLAVYVASYIPWVALGNQLVEGFPGGREGRQTFLALQQSMYDYHNNLRATHAASSPWWAWPLDLKPVWFYQEGLAGNTTALIYDAGNLVVFWLAIPAVVWAAWQAWHRRSLALALLIVGLVAQWIPWTRIDRATFQYHVYTALPFGVLALAYLLAELWHGPSRRTWLMARAAAAVALMAPALLWLARAPLCALAATERVHPGSEACGVVRGSLVVTDRALLTLVVLVVGLIALAIILRSVSSGWVADEEAAGPRGFAGWLPPGGGRLLGTGAVTLLSLFFVQRLSSDVRLLELPVGALGPLVFALAALVPLAGLAWLLLGARDSRRFVVGVVTAAGLWLLAFYPHIAALPLPNPYAHAYLGLLPTWNYAFQFAVNTDPPFKVSLLGAESMLLLGVATLTVGAVMYAAYSWRLELAARRAAPGMLESAD
ncbi:MAG TPA: phospholipid carrier-dependent glycosyltransferase [Candidatus Limnocylindrales bacterium]|nr:phospholipid carrier-dependent glycosyltransferase [Candidatus Limnocylindrales bacterium]